MASLILLCLLVVPLICILYLATMRPEIFFLPFLLPSAAQGVNVVLSNDDGWAEINIRSFYNALTAVGNSVVLSALQITSLAPVSILQIPVRGQLHAE